MPFGATPKLNASDAPFLDGYSIIICPGAADGARKNQVATAQFM